MLSQSGSHRRSLIQNVWSRHIYRVDKWLLRNGEVWGKQGVTVNRYQISFGADENALKVTQVPVAQLGILFYYYF